jgi:hypothetical protein
LASLTNFHEQVDVIGHDFDVQQLGSRLDHHVHEDFLEPEIDALSQDGTTKLRAPDDVVLARIDDVPVALVVHVLIIQLCAVESTIRSENHHHALYPHA